MHKSEIVEGIAMAIWPIGGSGHSFDEALIAAQDGNPDAGIAIQAVFAMAEGIFGAVSKKVGKRSLI